MTEIFSEKEYEIIRDVMIEYKDAINTFNKYDYDKSIELEYIKHGLLAINRAKQEMQYLKSIGHYKANEKFENFVKDYIRDAFKDLT